MLHKKWLVAIGLFILTTAAVAQPGQQSITPEAGFTHAIRFTYSPGQSFADATWTVPVGVTSLKVKLWAAGGGGSGNSPADGPSYGGGGGYTAGTVAVTPGQVINVIVGEGGNKNALPTYGGGGAGGKGWGGTGIDGNGGSGGGRSSIRLSGLEVLIAGGGGGASLGTISAIGIYAGPGNGTGSNSNGTCNSGKTALISGVAPGFEGAGAAPGNRGMQFEGGAGGNTIPGPYGGSEGGGGGGGGWYGGGGGCAGNVGTVGPWACNNYFYENGTGGGGSPMAYEGYVTNQVYMSGTFGGTTPVGAPGNHTDPQLPAGLAYGGTYAPGGNGCVVIEYTLCASVAPTLSGNFLYASCSATANLNSLVTSATPSGTTLAWYNNNTHSGSPFPTPTAAPPGTYYGYYNNPPECGSPYSAATGPVTIISVSCLTANNPAPKNGVAGGVTNGNAVAELSPSGGTNPYTYSNGTNDPGCTAVPGATMLPSGNITVNSNGTYTINNPTVAGTYYYCIKICDSGTPQQCIVKTYTLTISCTAGNTPPVVH